MLSANPVGLLRVDVGLEVDVGVRSLAHHAFWLHLDRLQVDGGHFHAGEVLRCADRVLEGVGAQGEASGAMAAVMRASLLGVVFMNVMLICVFFGSHQEPSTSPKLGNRSLKVLDDGDVPRSEGANNPFELQQRSVFTAANDNDLR